MLKKFFYTADIYPINPILYIFSKEKISSILGGILSLLGLFLFVFFAVYSITKVYNRTDIYVVFNQDTKKIYSMNHSNVPFFFSVFNQEGMPVQGLEKSIRFAADYQGFELENNQMIHRNFTIDIEKCNIEKHFTNVRDIRTDIPFIESFYCIPQNRYDLKLFGMNGDKQGFSLFQIYAFKCLFAHENKQECNDLDTTDKMIENSYLVWGTLDFDINHGSEEYPFTNKIISETYSMSSTIYKRLTIKRKEVSYKTDVGYFFQDVIQDTQYLFDYTDVFYDNIQTNQDNSYFMNVMVELSGKKDIFFKKFKKLPEALAEVMTIIKALQSLSNIFILIFHDQIYFKKLINKIFLLNQDSITKNNLKFLQLKDLVKSFESIEKTDDKKRIHIYHNSNISFNAFNNPVNNDEIVKINNTSAMNDMVSMSNLSKNCSERNSIRDMISDSNIIKKENEMKDISNVNNKKTGDIRNKAEIKPNQSKIKFSFYEYCFLCLQKNKNSNYDNMIIFKQIFKENLSVEKIILMFNEIEKIKNIFLTENELKLFQEIKFMERFSNLNLNDSQMEANSTFKK